MVNRVLARRAFVYGTWVVAAAVVVQVLLAGLGIFLYATFFQYHAIYGALVVFVVPLLMLVVGRIGGVPSRVLWMTAAIPGLVILQSLLLVPYHMSATGVLRAVSGLHAVNALAIFWVAVQLVDRARSLPPA